jgi:hypothetical protein
MAHKNGASSTRNERDSNAQRLGVKRFGGQLVSAGGTTAPTSTRATASAGVATTHGSPYWAGWPSLAPSLAAGVVAIRPVAPGSSPCSGRRGHRLGIADPS